MEIERVSFETRKNSFVKRSSILYFCFLFNRNIQKKKVGESTIKNFFNDDN